MGLVKIQNLLTKLGVEFEYVEINGLSKINLLDDKGDKHIIEENYYYNSTKLYLDSEEMMNQKKVCNWIIENELLLTNYEELKSQIKKNKYFENQIKREREIVSTENYEYGNYILKILTNRIGLVHFEISEINNTISYQPKLSLWRTDYLKTKKPLEITIRTVSSHDMKINEILEYIENMKMLVETVNYFNEILKPYNEVNKLK